MILVVMDLSFDLKFAAKISFQCALEE